MGTYDRTLIAKTLVHTEFEVDEGPFVLASVPLVQYKQVVEILLEVPGEPYIEIIRDSAEVSVVTTEEVWRQYFEPKFGSQSEELLAPLAKIFCKVPTEHPTCTGYLLAILDRLSPENIGVYVQGAYVTDHIFIDAENAEKTKRLLNELKSDMQAELDSIQ